MLVQEVIKVMRRSDPARGDTVYPRSTLTSTSNESYSYTSRAGQQSFGKSIDRMSSSYQTQMTTSTANYNQQGYNAMGVSAPNYGTSAHSSDKASPQEPNIWSVSATIFTAGTIGKVVFTKFNSTRWPSSVVIREATRRLPESI